jgi:hypothetical protein
MKAFLLSCLLPALASTSFAAAPQFKPRTDIPTGFKYLYGMVVADFNGDGKPDIAVTDNNVKAVYVYLNDGTGAFGSPKLIPVTMDALGPGPLLAGDFNEDGKQDIIVGTVAGLQADILLTGNGDGTFTQRPSLPGSFGYGSGIAADMNGDKHLDLIFGGNGSTSSYVGDGKGGFQQVTSPNLGGGGLYTGVVSDDFDKDGKPDVVIASPIPSSAITYHPGNGDGTFKASVTLSGPEYPQPRSLASADFNADGNPDLMLSSQYLTVALLGKGDGTFNTSAPSYFYTPIPDKYDNTSYAAVVAALDMDGDKKIDGVVADDFSRTINVFLNDGTGKFLQNTPDFSAAIDQGVAVMGVADLNGDRLPDIVVANNVTQNISIFLSIGPKTLPEITVSPSTPSALVGSSINVTVKVAGSNGIVPTGPVTLMDDSTSLGQQTLDANGQTVFTLSNLAAGFHTFSSVYAGDINYYSQTSILVGQAMMDIQIASTTPSQTVTAGATASYSVTITPASINGLNQTITLTCSQLPAFATCDPVTVLFFDKAVTATLTVKTVAPVRSQNSTTRYAFALLPLFAVCCIRRRRLLSPLLGITLICSLGFFVTGCSSSKPSTSTPGTPSGSSTFNITASGSFSGQALTRTTTATLVVQ